MAQKKLRNPVDTIRHVPYIQIINTGDADMNNEPEVQGPAYPILVINRRNGIQYGEKIRWIKPRKPKKKAGA